MSASSPDPICGTKLRAADTVPGIQSKRVTFQRVTQRKLHSGVWGAYRARAASAALHPASEGLLERLVPFKRTLKAQTNTLNLQILTGNYTSLRNIFSTVSCSPLSKSAAMRLLASLRVRSAPFSMRYSTVRVYRVNIEKSSSSVPAT